MSPENIEGIVFYVSAAGIQLLGAADNKRLSDMLTCPQGPPLSNGQNHPPKLIRTFSGSQPNASGKPAGAEGRRDPHAIDPLSHVKLDPSETQGEA